MVSISFRGIQSYIQMLELSLMHNIKDDKSQEDKHSKEFILAPNVVRSSLLDSVYRYRHRSPAASIFRVWCLAKDLEP